MPLATAPAPLSPDPKPPQRGASGQPRSEPPTPARSDILPWDPGSAPSPAADAPPPALRREAVPGAGAAALTGFCRLGSAAAAPEAPRPALLPLPARPRSIPIPPSSARCPGNRRPGIPSSGHAAHGRPPAKTHPKSKRRRAAGCSRFAAGVGNLASGLSHHHPKNKIQIRGLASPRRPARPTRPAKRNRRRR